MDGARQQRRKDEEHEQDAGDAGPDGDIREGDREHQQQVREREDV